MFLLQSLILCYGPRQQNSCCFTGQATALGAADPQPVTNDKTTKDAAALRKGSSDVPNQATADGHEAEEQQDNDWEPSPAAPKRNATTRGGKKAEPAKKPRRGHKQQPVVESDSQDSESFAEEEELASSSQLAEFPAVRKSRRRKHQVRAAASVQQSAETLHEVNQLCQACFLQQSSTHALLGSIFIPRMASWIASCRLAKPFQAKTLHGLSCQSLLCCLQVIEDDSLEDVRDSQPSSSKAADPIQLMSSGAELAAADADDKAVGASLDTQARRPTDRAAKSGSVLDRIAGLSSVLGHLPNKSLDSINAPRQSTAAGDTADMAESVGPQNSGKPSSVSLLDAVMNADEDDCYAAPVPTLAAKPEQNRAAQVQGTGTGASDKAAEHMLHNSVATQPDSGQSQHEQLAQAELTLPPNVAAKAGGPKPKGSLRERMKALGVIKS